jgi:hypothetical protein
MLISICNEEGDASTVVATTLECMTGHHHASDRSVIMPATVPLFFLSLSSLTSTIVLVIGVKVSVLCYLLNLEQDSLKERLA